MVIVSRLPQICFIKLVETNIALPMTAGVSEVTNKFAVLQKEKRKIFYYTYKARMCYAPLEHHCAHTCTHSCQLSSHYDVNLQRYVSPVQFFV